jgi:DNA (cytosine-5)-methyltransferase 1
VVSVGSLFSGIGGMDKGLERAGMDIRWQVEIDPFCQRVLGKYWPKLLVHDDIRTFEGMEPVDVLCGGFPCQDVSVAGKRKGMDGERSSLWSEFARLIGSLEPQWIMVENVRGLLSVDSGQFFSGILRFLAASGYDATWKVLRASDFGALHRRERVFLVANRDSERIKGFWSLPIHRVQEFSWCENVRGLADLLRRPDLPEPLICRMGDGASARLDAIGNSVVPAMAEYVGRCIMAAEDTACSKENLWVT